MCNSKQKNEVVLGDDIWAPSLGKGFFLIRQESSTSQNERETLPETIIHFVVFGTGTVFSNVSNLLDNIRVLWDFLK